MIFYKLPMAATFALAASALPQVFQSSTTTSSIAGRGTSSASQDGGVSIINNLNITVYLWSTVSTSSSSDMQSLAPGGGSYFESWQTTSDGSGISIKMSTTEDQSSVLQFEYTSDDGTLYWDLSSIDLDKDSIFVEEGFSATPDDSSCSAVTCAAGDADCAASYQNPDDDDTNTCNSAVQVTLTLG
ncbi:hypothetical protein BJX63DRAFT_413999 [Aspergillus granulosus]|uniref:Uncharacterized protein n=1 Tax=Aspergillus granulosus TaxID=176169 RepID=A0ABR4GUP4_9EURO